MDAKLTKAQARTIRRVLAAGGSVRIHQGRLGARDVNGHVFNRLEKLGLVEVVRESDAAARAAGHAVPMVRGYFATAAGCLALRAFDLANVEA